MTRPKDLHPRIERVVYRRWPNGDIVALFPDIEWNNAGYVASYEHNGQHGGADYAGVVSRTKPAEPEEYHDLHHELQNGGYVLRPARRR